MAFDARDQRVLITGASSGIGAALAERLASQGAIVGICARREERLREVLERCRVHSPKSRMWVCDLADPAAVDSLAAEALDDLGGVDVLVNNAGMRINYSSPVQLTLAVLPHMLARGSGRIVNVSSVAATLSSPGEAAYDASKAALSVFSEAMALDLWDTGIKVLIVYPGVVDTELFTIPDNDPLQPGIDKISVEELVDGVVQGLAADSLEVYVPEWFKAVAARKAADVGGFLAGSAAWIRQHQEA
jgi:short-subunit dehydrogenase